MMKTRSTSVAVGHRAAEPRRIADPELEPVSRGRRKHPVSIAVSMALLAAAANAALASEPTGTPAENAGASDPVAQDTPASLSPDAKKSKSGEAADTSDLETVTIIGVRESQERA